MELKGNGRNGKERKGYISLVIWKWLFIGFAHSGVPETIKSSPIGISRKGINLT